MARTKKSTVLSDAQKLHLKQFRHNIAVLKKKGLISKKYDARSVTPTKYLNSVIKNFSDVLYGRAGVATVSKKKAGEYRAAGYKTSGKKVVVPKKEGERIHVSRKGNITTTRYVQGGAIQIVDIPVPFHNLEQWLADISNPQFEGLKSPTDRWAFRFHGYNSLGTFSTLEQLVRIMHMYQSGDIHKALDTGNPQKGEDVYRNLSIVKIKRGQKWERSPSRGPSPEAKARQAMARKKYQQRRYENMTNDQYEEYLEQNKAHSRKMRERIAADPERLQEYRDKAAARARKSREKRKAKIAELKKQNG